MLRERVSQWNRCALIKEDAHSGWGERTARSVLKYRADLFERDARKPLNKLRDWGAVLEILKQSRYRNSRASKNQRSADTIRVAFDDGTSGPIDHDEDASTMAAKRLT